MQKRGNENSFLIILGLALMIITTNSTQLTIPLTPQKTFCFNQDMPRHTLIKLDVSGAGLPFRVQIMYLRQLLFNITATENLTKSITTQKFGIYRFCLTNEADKYNILTFQFASGVHAKDYSSHTQNSDYISSIQNQAKIALMFINQIVHQNKQGLEIMSENQKLLNQYSIEYFFSIIFIGIILVMSYSQFVMIKVHMANRKYI